MNEKHGKSLTADGQKVFWQRAFFSKLEKC